MSVVWRKAIYVLDEKGHGQIRTYAPRNTIKIKDDFLMHDYDIHVLTELEQKYNFQYPELYKRVYLDGMLDWGRRDLTFLLAGGLDIEIIPFGSAGDKPYSQTVWSEISDLRDPEDYRKVPSNFKFIPFAMTGGGDNYVFQFDLEENGDVPITQLFHDEENAQILSKNFEDFIFRSLIEEAIYVNEDFSYIFDRTHRESVLRTHKPYLKEQHFEILSEIYHRDLSESHSGLLTEDELNELFQREIPYARLDEKFKYMG
ncbi:SMI1/KNR4 family protein [Breznakiellaceae bacterium SP9]